MAGGGRSPTSGAAATRTGARRPASPARFRILVVGLTVALAFAMLLAVSLGAVAVPVGVSARILAHHLVPGSVDPTWGPVEDQIIWTFRLPRVLLGALVGAGLAVVGTVLQAVVRNPLADPYLLGISSGASLGAVLVLVLGSATIGGLSVSAAAFAGAVAATALVYVLARRRGRVTPLRLILAGVAVAYLFQAAYSYVILRTTNAQATQAAQGVLFWLLGSLGAVRWSTLTVPAIGLGIGCVVLIVQARSLNAVAVGDEAALSLGIPVQRFRVQMLGVTSLVTGVLVAVSGTIAFVGLIVPHLARLMVGADHRRVLPTAALTGALFLVLVDLVARTAEQGVELPLSIVTAVLGVPFFVWLLRRRERGADEAFG